MSASELADLGNPPDTHKLFFFMKKISLRSLLLQEGHLRLTARLRPRLTLVSIAKQELSGNEPCETVIKAQMTFFKKKIPKWSVLLKEEELGCVGSEMKGVKQNFRSRPPPFPKHRHTLNQAVSQNQ